MTAAKTKVTCPLCKGKRWVVRQTENAQGVCMVRYSRHAKKDIMPRSYGCAIYLKCPLCKGKTRISSIVSTAFTLMFSSYGTNQEVLFPVDQADYILAVEDRNA
jgi:hypothetical protein